jgi:hypothetical protein
VSAGLRSGTGSSPEQSTTASVAAPGSPQSGPVAGSSARAGATTTNTTAATDTIVRMDNPHLKNPFMTHSFP